jgi:hypothetical protein
LELLEPVAALTALIFIGWHAGSFSLRSTNDVAVVDFGLRRVPVNRNFSQTRGLLDSGSVVFLDRSERHPAPPPGEGAGPRLFRAGLLF